MRRWMALLAASALLALSGCGLFGGGEDAAPGLLETAAGLSAPCAVAEADGVSIGSRSYLYWLGRNCAYLAEALTAQGRNKPRHGELVYPGTCRAGLSGKAARAWRFAVEPGQAHWHDRRLGAQAQDVARQVGDFVLRRADGLWAYQLAVVVDDAAQGVTHVVRGEDLADNTARQLQLQRALGLPSPVYLHTPLVRGADGEKLSKQNGAQALDLSDAHSALNTAAQALGLPALPAQPAAHALATWVRAWAEAGGMPCR